MAVRVSATEVRVVITTSLLDTAIDAYIAIANPMVTNTVTCGLSEAVLKEIERWLTAHLIGITKERATTKEKLGEAAVEYAGTFGKGLEQTSWGQMVLQLDTCGQFANLGKKDINITAITSFE
ncbi:MAG: DUF4054 domain-containing protein [Candidatus Peribacteraceae bacterium]|nr:DUF4054 domain-containing protein [Candidatus Peribacteraceae bacterium]